jgi:DNA-binding transcriptional LysR family regulator
MKLNDVDLNKLQVFLILSQTGSMKTAGQILLRTPSAISQSISRLEKSLGLELFRRVGTRLYLTDEGKELAQGLARYQTDLSRLLGSLSRRQRELTGNVRLGLPPGFSVTRVGPLLGGFLQDAPQVQLRLRFLAQAELAEALSEGQLDLAISLQPLGKLNRNLVSRKLWDEELILVSSARMSALPDPVPVIEYYQAPALFTHWAKHHHGKLRQAIQVRAYASTLEYVVDLARRGVGVAVVPRDAVTQDLKDGSLHEVRGLKARPWVGSVWLNQVRSAYLSPACLRLDELFQL